MVCPDGALRLPKGQVVSILTLLDHALGRRCLKDSTETLSAGPKSFDMVGVRSICPSVFIQLWLRKNPTP